jgi:Protein of unknown function (DUF1266)
MAVPWLEVGAGLLVGGVGSYIAWLSSRYRRIKPGEEPEWFYQMPGHMEFKFLTRRIAVGAVLNEFNFFPVNLVHPCKPKAEMQEWLSDAWSVFDEYSATQQVESLLSSGHSDIFEVLVQRWPELGTEGVRQHLHDAFDGQLASDTDLDEFVDHYAGCRATMEQLGYITCDADLARGTRAYDYGRAVTVARVAHGAGYLSRRHANRLIKQAAALSAQAFGSWKQFAASYMLGRAIWGGVDDPCFMQQHEVVKYLQTSRHSPWVRLGWFD